MRGQVLVRAEVNKVKVTADVLDLEEESFRMFVLGALMKLGAVHGSSKDAGQQVQAFNYKVDQKAWERYKDQLRDILPGYRG
jgi:hypothetical protein